MIIMKITKIFGTIFIAINYILLSKYLIVAETAADTAIQVDDLNNEEVQQHIRSILLYLRNQTANEHLGVEIPDPMNLIDFQNHVVQGLLNANVSFQKMVIKGLSKFTIENVSANLAKSQVSLSLQIKEITVNGKYTLKGKFSFFRISGDGNFSMNVSDANITGTINIRVNEAGQLHAQDTEMDCSVNDIDLHFENLFGSGAMSAFSNKIVNALSDVIFDNVKPSLLGELSKTVEDSINEQLGKMPPQPLLTWSKSPLDVAIANSAAEIKKRGLDPYPFPNMTSSFKRSFAFFKVYGDASLYNGYLHGLSTIHRTGDMLISYNNNSFSLTANLGFGKLEGGFRWKAGLLGLSRQGGLHFRVKDIQIEIILSQLNEVESYPKVTSLEIKRLGQVGLDIDGLGSLDFVMEFIANFVTNVFKTQLSYILQNHIKDIMQQHFKEVKLPY